VTRRFVLLCFVTLHFFALYFWEDTVPKIKTHKSTAKRFRYTGGGKLIRMHQGRGHLRRHKDPRTLRKFRQEEFVEQAASKKRINVLAPYLDD
jgi:large subunit ribosomal protein L35